MREYPTGCVGAGELSAGDSYSVHFRLRFAMAVSADQSGDTEAPDAIIEDLDAMVIEILEYSRYRPGPFEVSPESFDFVKLLEDIVESNQALATDIEFTIQAVDESERMVRLDPKLVARAVSNLVSNAIRFARQHLFALADST